MKKVICLILSLVFVLCLSACKEKVTDKTFNYEENKKEVFEKVEDDIKKIEVKEENSEKEVEEKDGVVINYIEDVTHFRERTDIKIGDYEGATEAVCEKMGVDYKYVIKSIEVEGEEVKSITVDFHDYYLDLPEHFDFLLSLAATYTLGMDIEDVYYLEDGELYTGGPDGFFMSRDILMTEWPEIMVSIINER